MFTYQNRTVRTSVRQLVEFLLRYGDIVSSGTLVADVDAMQAGTRIHRKIQKDQAITYRAEVPLKMEWREDNFRLLLEGRADGIDRTTYGIFMADQQMSIESYFEAIEEAKNEADQTIYYVDEIKGIYQNVSDMEKPKTLHMAQAKCYAAIYSKQKELEWIGVQITYCNLDTEEVKRFRKVYKAEELEEWFMDLIDQYRMWASAYVEAYHRNRHSMDVMAFPYEHREGQKKLMAMVYHSIAQNKKVFFQAPTGIGKTISTIYPSLKTIASEKGKRVFYLTAKTITRTVAEDTLRLLIRQGMHIKAVTLTAKERVCSCEAYECNPMVCERARGHYDRINGAIYDLFTQEDLMTREVILDYALNHQVCPYQLAFEVASFCDFVICDYNYVFDPHVNRIISQYEGEMGKNILLIDESHNLVERAREMYSAVLTEEDFKLLKKMIPSTEKQLTKRFQSCRKEFNRLKKTFKDRMLEKGEDLRYLEYESVDGLYFPLFRFLEILLEYLTDHPVFEERDQVTECFFRLRHFQGIMETMTEGYRIYGMWTGDGFMIRLFCIDPSSQLKEIMEKTKASILFSATLLPMPYYRKLLYGEEADAFAIDSPFAKENRLLCITNDVTSRYTRRNVQEYAKILAYIEKSLQARPGNYMVFFPSYEMMEKTYALALENEMTAFVDIALQQSAMGEKEKEAYLAQFTEDREKSLVGFCVLGSIFSEGIDLSGKRLIGVLVVGTGLPRLSMQQDMIKDYFDSHDQKGYDYAYRYPGMNKVLQAAGRVIRSVTDVGIIVLMDDRFLWKENQYLLPADWDSYYEVSLENYSKVLEQFWQEKD